MWIIGFAAGEESVSTGILQPSFDRTGSHSDESYLVLENHQRIDQNNLQGETQWMKKCLMVRQKKKKLGWKKNSIAFTVNEKKNWLISSCDLSLKPFRFKKKQDCARYGGGIVNSKTFICCFLGIQLVKLEPESLFHLMHSDFSVILSFAEERFRFGLV